MTFKDLAIGDAFVFLHDQTIEHVSDFAHNEKTGDHTFDTVFYNGGEDSRIRGRVGCGDNPVRKVVSHEIQNAPES